MDETTIASHIAVFASHAHVWGLLIIFVFMTIESSFIPFPSEVVMIPAGFLAARGEMTTGIVWMDCVLAVIVGTMGSLAGAYINYYLALWIGRKFLYTYGKYFFLKPETLERAEEIFRKYGDMATFVCRLLPAIRQLISIPAGLAKMDFKRFTFFTGIGAGIWIVILTAVGAWLGHASRDMDYVELVNCGKKMITSHYGWIIAGLVVVCGGYWLLQKLVMKSEKSRD
ncbi:MAG: DedA family protein [Victivallaceae bacterium]|nr:DedA family protein [Victivallaceae bacterium]